MKIAVAGKGGTGKTLVAGGLATLLARAGYTTLAIDADSAPNLGFVLGIPPEDAKKILPVSSNEDLIAAKTGTGYPGVYTLNFSVEGIVEKYALPTPAGPHLLVMGTVTSLGSGCTCPANSVLRALLRHLITERDEAIILDMEAGVEHLGRGTAESVDMMLVVTDANRQSLGIAGTIARMATEAGIPRVSLVGNRIAAPDQEEAIRNFSEANHLDLLGMIPFDPVICQGGINGVPIHQLDNPAALDVLGAILKEIAVRRKKDHREIPEGCENK